MADKKPRHTTKLSDYVEAFLGYLGRPKTVFDLKDRAKLLVILALSIIILQCVVQLLGSICYN